MNTLDAALAYAAHDIAVFPCKPTTKAPYIKRGLNAASTDSDRIREWWRHYPDAMIGAPAGDNNFFAVDLDMRDDLNGVGAWFEINQNSNEIATPGAIGKTPSGGFHYLFAKPARKVMTRAGKLAPGIDIRGDGGYIVLPPSCNADGVCYEWQNEWHPAEPLSPAPDWLLDLVCEQPDDETPEIGRMILSGGTVYGLTALEGEVEKIRSAKVGTRNDVLNNSAFKIGQLVGGGEIEEDAAVKALSDAAAHLSADDGRDATLKTIISGMQSGIQNPRTAPTVPTFMVDVLDTDQLVIPTNEYYHTDAGNSELIRDLYRDYLRYDHRRHRWLLWQGHRWEQDCDYKIMNMALNAARLRLQMAANLDDRGDRKRAATFAFTSENRNRITSALEIAKNLDPIADVSPWDADLFLLACSNGVLDLRTGTLRDGKPTDRVTLTTGMDYAPDADCPRWEQFLLEIFDGDPHMVGFIQRALGYSLTGDTREQCLFLCWGGGANGKSTMLNIVRSMLGEYAANTPFSTFELQYSNSNTNDLAALADRRLVTAAETNDARRLNESRVKVATGSDPVTARYLYHENFTYIPQFKIFLAMNHKPRITGVDDGIWRRIRLVPYTVSFKDNADYTLESKLRDELPGILAWAVRGCLDWQKQGLNPPDTVKDATDTYRIESDPIARFMDECVTQDPDGRVKASQLYKRYCRWAELYNERPVSSTAFGLRMVSEGYQKHKSTYVNYLGMKLNETDSSEGSDS